MSNDRPFGNDSNLNPWPLRSLSLARNLWRLGVPIAQILESTRFTYEDLRKVGFYPDAKTAVLDLCHLSDEEWKVLFSEAEGELPDS
jgi:hypothetical protein